MALKLALLAVLSLLSLLLQLGQGADINHPWNYDTLGVDVWPHEFSGCRGTKQSPIDVQNRNVEFDKSLRPFKLINYNLTQTYNVSHNGHTVVVSRVSLSSDKVEPFIGVEGSDFDNQFELLQFHFHWGFNNFHGSEHYIDGTKFPLEMHLVHKSKQGLFTVLGFLFKLSDNNNPALDPLLNAVNVARSQGDWAKSVFSLSSILLSPGQMTNYYRYSGSLTTPPCTEGVIWNLFANPISISSEQLLNFRNNRIKLNFREPQKLYSRKVFSSFPIKKSNSGGASAGGAHGNDTDHSNSASRMTNNGLRAPYMCMSLVGLIMALF